MAIPTYDEIMLPLLNLASNEKEWGLQEAINEMTLHFGLNEEEQQKLLPSGRQPVIHNRVGWARTYLAKAGLLEKTRRGYFRITDRGKEALGLKSDCIDIDFLSRYPEFVAFKERSSKKEETGESSPVEPAITPEESIESSYRSLRQQLADELLENIKTCSPTFFERLVIDLLVAMGYGGSRRDAAHATKRSGDDGIDGIIKEDRLGLDAIYIQAKRWENPVRRPEVQKFAGALSGNKAKKGVFITTSLFTSEAQEYVSRVDNKIVLIDGEVLTDYMIDFNIGVSLTQSYDLKQLDSDYFEE